MTLRARGDSAEIKQQEGIQNTCQEKKHSSDKNLDRKNAKNQERHNGEI